VQKVGRGEKEGLSRKHVCAIRSGVMSVKDRGEDGEREVTTLTEKGGEDGGSKGNFC